MSGFFCVLHEDGSPVEPALLERLTARMDFRGPDARRIWCNESVGLGHTLLAVTFESHREQQPGSLDGETWLAGDIRVDGRCELIASLRASGRDVAADTTDAELVLHAYALWGDGCLDRIIGDFAFALWDGARQRLLAARDHFGVAQLFWARMGSTLIIGNTLQAILAHHGLRDDLDEEAIFDLAIFGMNLDDAATAYQSIRRLPQGHKLSWEAGQLKTSRYWAPPGSPDWIHFRRDEEYVEQFLELFDQAVADRLRTDRAGTHLSGGLDASSIAATAAAQLRARGEPFDLRAYNMVYRELFTDEEGHLSGLVAERSGFPLESLGCEEAMDHPPPAKPERLPPEPGPLYAPGWDDIRERTASFSRLLFAGFGGDPLLDQPPFSVSAALAALRQGDWRWPAKSGLRQLKQTIKPPENHWSAPGWPAQHLLAAHRPEKRWQSAYHRQRRDVLGMWTAPLWRSIFAWSDAGHHGQPVSVVFPFFDRRLFDFVAAVPPHLRGRQKPLLRRAMADRLPAALLSRPKTPLPAHLYRDYLRNRGIPIWGLELLREPALAPWLDPAWLPKLSAQSEQQRIETWLTQSPPVSLAYWLRHRPNDRHE